MILPVIDALTTPISPLCRANKAMISSAAFPNVAFSNPPIPDPRRSARISVPLPIKPARGMMAIADVTKIAVSDAPAIFRPIAVGTKTSSKFNQPTLRSNSISPVPQ